MTVSQWRFYSQLLSAVTTAIQNLNLSTALLCSSLAPSAIRSVCVLPPSHPRVTNRISRLSWCSRGTSHVGTLRTSRTNARVAAGVRVLSRSPLQHKELTVAFFASTNRFRTGSDYRKWLHAETTTGIFIVLLFLCIVTENLVLVKVMTDCCSNGSQSVLFSLYKRKIMSAQGL